jgi:RNA polymerase sigma-70 factor (ECF subfamily)
VPGPEAVDDAELLRRAADGDAAAFEGVVSRHEARLFRFARALTRDATAAEDALQEAFLAAWRGAAGFRGGPSAAPWLLTIVRHQVHRQHRRRAGQPSAFASLEELGEQAGWGAADDPEAVAITRERRERVQVALDALGDEEREVLVLRELEGLTGEETAAALGIGLAAMKSRLHRARLRFAARLREGGRDGR